MDEEETKEYMGKLIPSSYVARASDARKMRATLIKVLLKDRRIPKKGWDDATIETFLQEVSQMDSNNFIGSVGTGEREGRTYSDIVARRHFRLCHGIGRSGDIAAVQPKAAGSSLINKLTQSLALHALRLSGLHPPSLHCVVLPVCTGLSLSLTLLSLKKKRPGASIVLFPRIDQKACLKAIVAAGFEVIIISNRTDGDELRTDLSEIETAVSRFGEDRIFGVVTTTSCFAPRGCDAVGEVAKICDKHGLVHVVNNAYGLQSTKCTSEIERGMREGRVDAFVQSTDKNFMVPVGGAIVASPSEKTIEDLAKSYPGRASMAPLLDLFITLLSMGEEGYLGLLKKRKEVYQYFQTKLKEFCAKREDIKLLHTPHNGISMALALTGFEIQPYLEKRAHLLKEEEEKGEQEDEKEKGKGKEGDKTEEEKEKKKEEELSKDITLLGSMLFSRQCSGSRIVSCLQHNNVAGLEFAGWGSHSNFYPYPYITVAAAIGMEKEEVDVFIKRLGSCLKDLEKKRRKRRGQ